MKSLGFSGVAPCLAAGGLSVARFVQLTMLFFAIGALDEREALPRLTCRNRPDYRRVRAGRRRFRRSPRRVRLSDTFGQQFIVRTGRGLA